MKWRKRKKKKKQTNEVKDAGQKHNLFRSTSSHVIISISAWIYSHFSFFNRTQWSSSLLNVSKVGITEKTTRKVKQKQSKAISMDIKCRIKKCHFYNVVPIIKIHKYIWLCVYVDFSWNWLIHSIDFLFSSYAFFFYYCFLAHLPRVFVPYSLFCFHKITFFFHSSFKLLTFSVFFCQWK